MNSSLVDEGWIEKRSGIQSRFSVSEQFFSTEPERRQFLAEAVRSWAETHPELDTAEICITVSSHPIQHSPTLAQFLTQTELQVKKRFVHYELFQPSTGVLSAMSLARAIQKPTLIFFPEVMTSLLTPEDPSTAILFGDTFVGALLHPQKTPQSQYRIISESFSSLPEASDVLVIEGQPAHIRMKGPELYKQVLPEFVRSARAELEKNHFSLHEVQWYLPHQANLRMMEKAADSIGFQNTQILSSIEHHGNTSNASTWLTLKLNDSKIKTGDKILLNACGAGLTSGAALLEKL